MIAGSTRATIDLAGDPDLVWKVLTPVVTQATPELLTLYPEMQ
jgi:hypothetical protein